MHRRGVTLRAGLLLALVIPLAGCAGNGVGMPEEATSPPTSPPGRPEPVPSAGRPAPDATDLPLLPRPTEPPRKPTDSRPADLLVGRIVRGGAGPCFGLVDDDGREYALYGPDAAALTTGTYVTLRVAPHTDPVDCGPGLPRRIVTD